MPLRLLLPILLFLLSAPPSKPPAPPPLLPLAHRIMSATDWQEYDWMSSEEVLAFVGTSSDPKPRMIHITSGQDYFLEFFPDLFAHRPNRAHLYMTLSPDRQSVLWYECPVVAGHSDRWVVAALDGKQMINVAFPREIGSPGDPVWAPDSRRWAMLWDDARKGPVCYVFSVEKRSLVREIPLPQAGKKEEGKVIRWIVGFTQSGHILSSVAQEDGSDKVEMLECASAGKQEEPHRYTIRLLKPAVVNDCILSPKGDRLAWLLEERKKPSADKDAAGGARLELWISRRDGSGLQAMGFMDIASENVKRTEWYPSQLSWLPDGKRLSFIYKDALYTVPVE